MIKHGDYSKIAKDYIYRPGYSISVLNAILRYTKLDHKSDVVVADVGAGTGKLTENLMKINLSGYAIEPNDAMREEGIKLFGDNKQFKWLKGHAEKTGLNKESIDYVLMGSSFHWTDTTAALIEFHRILKPNGWFTALWNPRNIERCYTEPIVERIIRNEIPELKRVSSGAKEYTQNMDIILESSGLFGNLIFMEGSHEVIMTPDQYIRVWHSANDIRSQAGEERFKKIISMIKEEIRELSEIKMVYNTRAWSVQKMKS